MFKYLLISIVIVPVLLGVMAARNRGPVRGFTTMLASSALFGVFWLLMLHFLRHRWLG